MSAKTPDDNDLKKMGRLPRDPFEDLRPVGAPRPTGDSPSGDVNWKATDASELPHLTELGLAQHIERDHGSDLRFCPELGAWLCFNGAYWVEDIDGHAIRLAKRTVARLHREAKAALAAVADVAEVERPARMRTAKDMLAFATACEKESRLRAGLSLAKAEMFVHANALGQDQMLLAAGRSVVDLRTGMARLPRRDDYIARVTNIEFDPLARSETWERFLVRVVPDAAARAYLQRADGYTLTGDIREHCLFFLFGDGANGKSVFLRVLEQLLGEYAWAADDGLLLSSANQAHPTTLAALHRRRLVVCNEIDEGRDWAEARLKTITGGDPITARRMREDFWCFMPTHKLWIAANHKPRARGIDHGLWRRIKLIPFGVQIPEAERDSTLPEKLRAELPGILNWAVAGCLDWQQNGLGEPPAVRAATESYRVDQDAFGGWLKAACVIEPGARITKASARASFAAWCAAEGEREMDAKTFTKRLRALGLGELGGVEHRWEGLRLRDDVAQEAPKSPGKGTRGTSPPIAEDRDNPPLVDPIGADVPAAAPSPSAGSARGPAQGHDADDYPDAIAFDLEAEAAL